MNNKKMFIDMHTHSEYSSDGYGSIYNMYISAKKNNIDKFAITDHFDFSINKKMLYYNDISDKINYYNNLDEKLEILSGIEIGQPHINIKEALNLTKKHNFDFILVSLHEFSNGERAYLKNQIYNKATFIQHMEKYFNELLIMINNFEFNSLAHIDYVFRYTNYKCHYFNLSQFKNYLSEIFKVLINKNCALEMNAKSLFESSYNIETDIFILYKDLGGKLLTLGSDAHFPDNIGKNIDLCKKYAINCGFKTATYFKKQIPIQYKL